MELELCKHVMENEKKRAAYDALAKEVFDLSFEAWYKNGFWSDTNQPYTLFDGERAVANVSINRMHVEYEGKIRNYIQLGTVMTAPDCRGQGLAARLMEEVLADVRGCCDAVFLFANRSVLDFYPRFGFRRQAQYGYALTLEKSTGTDILQNKTPVQDSHLANAGVRKLVMSDAGDIALLRRCYARKNPFSRLQAIDNFGLLMFYCGSIFADCVYYCEALDAVMIAEAGENTLRCYDIFCEAGKGLRAVLEVFLPFFGAVGTVTFGFTPKEAGLVMRRIEDDDDALFVLDGGENIFSGDRLYFPELSHT